MPPAYLNWACLNCSVNITGLGIVPTPPVNSQSVQLTATDLPLADYLVVTWTEGETNGACQVLGAGKYFFHQMIPKGNNLVPLVLSTQTLPLPNQKEVMASEIQCHAYYFTTKVAGKSVIVLKSNFHPKEEGVGPTLGVPMQNFFKWLALKGFKYIISTGTSGGIWPGMDVGDVVVCNSALYDPGDAGLKAANKAGLLFTSGVTNLVGNLTGGKSQYDTISANLNSYASCALVELAKARQASNGKVPHIYYAPLGPGIPNIVISDTIIKNEENNVENNNYKSKGAAFDNNDAFVGEALKQAGYGSWVSIRNISDIAGDKDDVYDTNQDCSSIIGALAVYAFIAGH